MTNTTAAIPPRPAGRRPPRPADWSTASLGQAPGPSTGELELLGRHLEGCRGRGGRWFVWHCRAEAAQEFAATHIVTTLMLLAVLAALAGAALL